jgi:hypothetical protein
MKNVSTWKSTCKNTKKKLEDLISKLKPLSSDSSLSNSNLSLWENCDDRNKFSKNRTRRGTKNNAQAILFSTIDDDLDEINQDCNSAITKGEELMKNYEKNMPQSNSFQLYSSEEVEEQFYDQMKIFFLFSSEVQEIMK